MKRKFAILFVFLLGFNIAPVCSGEQPLFKNPAAGKPESWVYRTSEKHRDWLVMRDTSKYIKDKDGRSLMVVLSEPEHRRFSTTMIMEPDNMKTISVTVTGETEIVQEARYAGSMASIQYRGFKKREQKKIWVTAVTYDQRTLFWLLRGYPFQHPREIEIDLIMPLGNRCSVKVRYLGTEGITVPAGKFKAHKLEMEPNAILPVFSEKLKTYFWFSTERIPRFLKYAYPAQGVVAELVK